MGKSWRRKSASAINLQAMGENDFFSNVPPYHIQPTKQWIHDGNARFSENVVDYYGSDEF